MEIGATKAVQDRLKTTRIAESKGVSLVFCWDTHLTKIKGRFDAYGYPSELFKLDMERLGIVAKRKPAKIIDFTKYIDTNRSTNH